MIDAHVHFWNFDANRDNWITEEMSVIRNDFSPKNLIRTYNELKITGCIAVQANQSEAENNFLLTLAEQNEIIKGIVGWVDLKNPKLDERLKHWNSFKKIKGFRHVLQAENAEFFLSDDFIHGVKKLNNYNFTYDLLCYHNQLADIIKLIDKLDDQPLVLDHCGKPDIKSGNVKKWKENVKILAQNPNVSCKISGLLVEADWKNWKEAELFECFDTIIESFGTDRVMYGSDWPVVLVSKPYANWFQLVEAYASRLTFQEKENLFLKNATRFYKL
ncbi:amidohydrolase family protein [Pedobacter aquatilis]|uniref:amidohydrolase family protein n=1 Tax=Pedobacter aquatilis TaxID=351343 RepID=UPI0025B2A412|nr:amidohydrolase family protein [Pedobacter aquatilis]MDN3588610.1 amidohydrolase family protein [Pedobacter aquatilis]